MTNKLLKSFLFFMTWFALQNTTIKFVFLNEKEIAQLEFNSACSKSFIYPITNEYELKNEIYNALLSSIKKMIYAFPSRLWAVSVGHTCL